MSSHLKYHMWKWVRMSSSKSDGSQEDHRHPHQKWCRKTVIMLSFVKLSCNSNFEFDFVSQIWWLKLNSLVDIESKLAYSQYLIVLLLSNIVTLKFESSNSTIEFSRMFDFLDSKSKNRNSDEFVHMLNWHFLL